MNEKRVALKTLYERLKTDFEVYKHWLLIQPKSEILRLAPEFLARKAIIEAAKRFTKLDLTSRHYLFSDQIEILQKFETPLDDICEEFFVNSDYCRLVFGDSIENAFESRANDLQRRKFLAAKCQR